MKFILNPKWHGNINNSEPSKVIFQKYIKWIQILPGQSILYKVVLFEHKFPNKTPIPKQP